MGNFAQNKAWDSFLGAAGLVPFQVSILSCLCLWSWRGRSKWASCGFELRLKVGPQSQAVSGQFHKMAQ